MTLSSRALAFSVDNLLKSSSYKTNGDALDDAAVQHPTTKQHMLAYVKSADLSTNQTITRRKCVDKKDEFVEEEYSLKSANHNRDVSNRYVKCVLTSDNIVVHKKGGSKEQVKGNLEDDPATVVGNCSFHRNITDAQRHIAKETNFCSLPFPASGNAVERNKQTRPPTGSHFRTSGPMTSSCFCHGEVTFCQHPGIISVLDSAGSNKSVIAKLCHADLWSSFHALGTEMIITKSGRRMFPALKVKFCGLDPAKLYTVRLEFLQPDSRKYRYIYHSSRWMVSGSGDIITSQQCHKAVEEPISGQIICSQIVSFERLKLTNTEPAKSGQVSLVSMQKFQPQLVVEEVSEADMGDSPQTERYTIMFPQTSFMAVTAYQNHRITTLKIASNPFAKGFRESGKDRIPYESLMHQVPVFRKSEQHYLHRIMSPAMLPEFFPRDRPSMKTGKKRNNEEIGVDSYTVPKPKMLKQMDDNPEEESSHIDAAKGSATEHSLLYSELYTPLSMSSYLHQRRRNYQQQLIQELQHGQHNVLPSVSLYLQSVLHHSTYNSSMLAQLTPRALYDAPQQTTPAVSGHISMQPPPAHISFQPIPTPTSKQESMSPLMATIPSTSSAVLPFQAVPTVPAKPGDNEASMRERDLRSCPMFCCTESQLDQLALVQQSRVRSLNVPMFSSSLTEQQQYAETSDRRRASDSSSRSPGAFTPLYCLTDQAKLTESGVEYGVRCVGCDYQTLGKMYELVPGGPPLDCRNPQ